MVAEDGGAGRVCPTYVGMNRFPGANRAIPHSMPHVCGDEPLLGNDSQLASLYAPRMWG